MKTSSTVGTSCRGRRHVSAMALGAGLFVALIVGNSPSALAQSTRVEAIAEEQAEKAKTQAREAVALLEQLLGAAKIPAFLVGGG